MWQHVISAIVSGLCWKGSYIIKQRGVLQPCAISDHVTATAFSCGMAARCSSGFRTRYKNNYVIMYMWSMVVL
jgi:hypothetical protein